MLSALSTHALDLLRRDAGGTAALVTMHLSVAEQERIAAKAQASIYVGCMYVGATECGGAFHLIWDLPPNMLLISCHCFFLIVRAIPDFYLRSSEPC